jgi:hypothetical protein
LGWWAAGGAGFEFVDDGEAVVGALLLEDFDEGGGAGVAEAGDGDAGAGDDTGGAVVVLEDDAVAGAADAGA